MHKFLFVILFLIPSIAISGQSYKRWFMDQQLVGCPGCAVGMVEPAYYNDSLAIYLAFVDGCVNYLKQKSSIITIDKKDWGTEAGNVSIEDSFAESIDTMQLADVIKQLVIIDTMYSKNFIAVLVGSKSCSVDESLKQELSISDLTQGGSLFSSDTLQFTGNAPEYYFEKSSWIEAERRARREAAYSLHSKVSSIGRLIDFVFDERRNQITDVELRNTSVIRRWINKATNIYCVTIKME